jgi:histidine triad (HIT) family protein
VRLEFASRPQPTKQDLGVGRGEIGRIVSRGKHTPQLPNGLTFATKGSAGRGSFADSGVRNGREACGRSSYSGVIDVPDKTIFKRILDREIPADLIYEDDEVVAFNDVNPQAPVHVLVIPRKEIPSLAHAEDGDSELLGRMLLVVRDLAKTLGLDDGYRTVINTGRDGGQTVAHLHMHLLGQRSLNWPPG